MKNYIPSPGDIVWIDFDPVTGHEQAGNRPALVISHMLFSKRTGLAILCPITTTIRNYPSHVELSGTKTEGFVMTEHVKSVDYRARSVKFKEKASVEMTKLVSARVKSLMVD